MFTYPFFYYPNERADPLQSIRMPAFVHLLCIDLLIVDTAPCIEDISNHKRYKNRYVGHCLQSELAGTTIT